MPRTPNTQLPLLLAAAGWSPAQLARAVRRLAAEHGLEPACHHTTVRRWLDGTQPRPPLPTLLLECFSRRLGRPVTAREAGLTRTPAIAVAPSWSADPVRKLIHLTQAELDPRRRLSLGAGLYAATSLGLPDPPRQDGHPGTGISPGPGPGPGPGGHPTADQMRATAAMFATAADQHGGQYVRAALGAYISHDVIPHLHARAHPGTLSAAAQLTLLLGRMCVDAGHDATAQYYHQIAARLAADARDHTTLAISLRTMATHAYDLGHRAPAVLHLTEQADRYARQAPPAIRAYTLMQVAVLQAHHDREAALTALAEAERFHARSQSAPGPFSSYPPGALHYQRAQALTALGDLTGAIAILTASVRLRVPAERLPGALTGARLAEAHLRLGHLEQAVHHWRGFLDVYPTLHSARATRRLETARQRLLPYRRHRAAAALLEQVRDFAGARR